MNVRQTDEQTAAVFIELRAMNARLAAERDEARAEVERLREDARALAEALRYCWQYAPTGWHSYELARNALAKHHGWSPERKARMEAGHVGRGWGPATADRLERIAIALYAHDCRELHVGEGFDESPEEAWAGLGEQAKDQIRSAAERLLADLSGGEHS